MGPRGVLGRGPWEFTADLHADWKWKLALGSREYALRLGADLFNLLDRRSAVEIDTSAQCLFGPNLDLGTPLRLSAPFSVRLLARLEF